MGKSELSALKCSRIEDSDVGSLQALIRQILHEGGSHNAGQFSAASWDWQYRRLPSGEAHVFVIKDGNDIVGYYHAPVYRCRIDGRLEKVAMVQDVATINAVRGRGVFRRLASYAVSELTKLDIAFIYTFPNAKSIRTFLKYTGYEKVLSYDAYVLPVRSKVILDSRARIPGFNAVAGAMLDAWTRSRCRKMDECGRIAVEEQINPEVTKLFNSFSQSFPCGLVRDESYLRWRFVDKPESTHFCFSYLVGDRVKAAAIFKVDSMFGVPALVLLDFAFVGQSPEKLGTIVGYAARNAQAIIEQDIALIFASFSNPAFLGKSRFGFLKVPTRLNPRPLHLLVNDVKGLDAVSTRDSWHATLADWDVF
jgi:hypothetical protein